MLEKLPKRNLNSVAAPLAPENSTRHSEQSNKEVSPPRLGFTSTSAVLIISLFPLMFGIKCGQFIVELPTYGAVAKILGTVAMDEDPVLLFMVMRLKIFIKPLQILKGVTNKQLTMLKTKRQRYNTFVGWVLFVKSMQTIPFTIKQPVLLIW